MLLIYLPAVSSRCEYIFELIFKNELNLKYRITSDVQIFESYLQEKINYSFSRLGDEFFIWASPLLFEDSIKKIDVIIEEKHQTKVLFPNDTSCNMGFDIFSAIFFMVSRYEEYLPFAPDTHGRFKPTDSVAYKNNFLRVPVVDTWINRFKTVLRKKFPSIQIMPSTFKALVTYDIDVAYKFKGRTLKRNTGATIKDLLKLDLKNIYSRFQTLNNKQKDPWDVYDYVRETIVQNKLESIFFFLLGDASVHDRNLNYKNPLVKKLIDTIKSFSEIGIHPSYKTSAFPEKLLSEKKRLEQLSGKRIYKSRQHYLKFILPATYNSLIEAGITEDYSMGFSALPGFRAGTCKPFYFYDLKNEKITGLKIFPITFMEGSFIDYKKSLPSQALQDIFNLIEAVKNVQGTFISIWHNNTLSDTREYRDWKNVHDQMIHFITRILCTNYTNGLHELHE
ncbi:MAG: polysaccharide deacetylase family protein [Ginsengibacter sp.]